MVLTLVKWPPIGDGYWVTPTYSAQYVFSPAAVDAGRWPMWVVLDRLWRQIERESPGPGRFTLSGFEVDL